MKRSIALLLAFVAVLAFFLSISHSYAKSKDFWSDSFYDTFTPETFKDYGPANHFLDFKKIDYPLLNAAIFFEISRVRVAHGKSRFLHSKALEKAAISHSRSMVEKGFFGHADPYDPSRSTPLQRMEAFGVREKITAENIASAFGIRYKAGSPVIPPTRKDGPFRDFRTGEVIRHHTYNSLAEAVVDEWMQSAGHRANILDERLKSAGIGLSHFEDRKFYNMHTFKVTLDMSSDVPK